MEITIKEQEFIDNICQRILDFVLIETKESDDFLDKIDLLDKLTCFIVIRIIDNFSKNTPIAFPCNIINWVASFLNTTSNINCSRAENNINNEEKH